MAKFNKKTREKVQPKIEDLFEKFNEILSQSGMGEFSVKEFKVVSNDGPKALNCPCGIERVMLPSGRIVEQCRPCPPSGE